MKIIELGNVDLKFICLECKTVFEISTKELYKESDTIWSICCPLCGEKILVKDTNTINFMIKREKLDNKIIDKEENL